MCEYVQLWRLIVNLNITSSLQNIVFETPDLVHISPNITHKTLLFGSSSLRGCIHVGMLLFQLNRTLAFGILTSRTAWRNDVLDCRRYIYNTLSSVSASEDDLGLPERCLRIF